MTVDIHFERRGRAGFVTLDRPKALNALTHDMCLALEERLRAWAEDPAVAHVVIGATGERAFCAGGDIRRIWELGKAGDPRQLDFFRDEYRLNALIARYPKPYTALLDGIVMGGGFGVSVHGRYRVGGDRLTFAMPEVAIGHFPDVGATHFLPRCPGAVGTWLALTGARIKRADARHAGVLTHSAASDRFPELAAALAAAEDPAPVLAAFDVDDGPAPLAARRDVIDRVFAAPTVAAILAALEAETGPEAGWAAATLAEIRAKSPTSLLIALRQMREGVSLDFDAAMRLEFRIVSRIMLGHDFYEGVRAAIVDKDGRPVWRPARIEDVDPAEIEAHFRAPPGGDLGIW